VHGTYIDIKRMGHILRWRGEGWGSLGGSNYATKLYENKEDNTIYLKCCLFEYSSKSNRTVLCCSGMVRVH